VTQTQEPITQFLPALQSKEEEQEEEEEDITRPQVKLKVNARKTS